MGKRYLLDTNTILDYMGNKLPDKSRAALASIIDDEINISVINKIELLGFEKAEKDLVDFVNCSNILTLTDEIVDKTVDVRKLFKIKLPDAIIAATALQNDLTLITNDARGFKNIEGLDLINPHEI
jgi:predicted nucleic acid-binding protein